QCPHVPGVVASLLVQVTTGCVGDVLPNPRVDLFDPDTLSVLHQRLPTTVTNTVPRVSTRTGTPMTRPRAVPAAMVKMFLSMFPPTLFPASPNTGSKQRGDE